MLARPETESDTGNQVRCRINVMCTDTHDDYCMVCDRQQDNVAYDKLIQHVFRAKFGIVLIDSTLLVIKCRQFIF